MGNYNDTNSVNPNRSDKMIKATKKELNDALELACAEGWKMNLPNGKCVGCICNYVDECPKCWKKYYLETAKKSEERR